MATITQTVTTSEEVNYETPVYRKMGTTQFINIFDSIKMLVVDTTPGFESVKVAQFPGSGVRNIASTDESNEAEFVAAYDAAVAAIDLIVNPA